MRRYSVPGLLISTPGRLSGRTTFGASPSAITMALPFSSWPGPHSAPPMSMLRSCVSVMGLTDPRAESADPDVNIEMAQELTARGQWVVFVFHEVGGERLSALEEGQALL